MNKAREFDQSVLAELKRCSASGYPRRRVASIMARTSRIFPTRLPMRRLREDHGRSPRRREHLPSPPRADIPYGVAPPSKAHPPVQARDDHMSQMNGADVHEQTSTQWCRPRDEETAQRAHQAHGLFFPIDPAADATLACRDARLARNACATARCARNVLSLKVCSPTPHHPDLAPPKNPPPATT